MRLRGRERKSGELLNKNSVKTMNITKKKMGKLTLESILLALTVPFVFDIGLLPLLAEYVRLLVARLLHANDTIAPIASDRSHLLLDVGGLLAQLCVVLLERLESHEVMSVLRGCF